MAGRSPLIILTFLGILLLQGCRSMPYEPGRPFENPELSRELQGRLEDMYPRFFRVVHRCILEAAGRQFILDGYLLVRRPDSFRLVAKGDMGGTVFELYKAPGLDPAIARTPAQLRRAWLEEGAARDLVALYLRTPGAGAHLVRHGTEALGLAQELPDGTREEFLFQPDGHRLISYFRSRGDRCLYRADFSYFGLFAGWPREVPKTVTITDHVLKYKLTVSILEIAQTDNKP